MLKVIYRELIRKEEKIMKEKLNGRPSVYNPKIHDKLIYQLVRDNKRNDDIAENYFGIVPSTLYEWLNTHPSFSEAYKKGQEAKVDNVEMNLYQRAAGVTIKETTVIKKNGKDVEEVKEVTKEIPPDVGAMCFILKTQRRKQWSESQNINISTQEKDPLTEALEKLSNKEEK